MREGARAVVATKIIFLESLDIITCNFLLWKSGRTTLLKLWIKSTLYFRQRDRNVVAVNWMRFANRRPKLTDGTETPPRVPYKIHLSKQITFDASGSTRNFF